MSAVENDFNLQQNIGYEFTFREIKRKNMNAIDLEICKIQLYKHPPYNLNLQQDITKELTGKCISLKTNSTTILNQRMKSDASPLPSTSEQHLTSF